MSEPNCEVCGLPMLVVEGERFTLTARGVAHLPTRCIERLAARLAEAERDAARYRWLRDNWTVTMLNGTVTLRNAFGINGRTVADVEASIDAEIASATVGASEPRLTAEEQRRIDCKHERTADTVSVWHTCLDCGKYPVRASSVK